MVSYSFVVVMIAVVLFDYSYGDVDDTHCEERSTGEAPTRICINKPPNYDDNRMNELVEENKDWMRFNYKPMDNIDEIYPGDENNCGTHTKTEEPYMLKTNNSMGISVHHVVQSIYFKQSFTVTRCLNMNNSCLKEISADGKYSCQEKLGTVSLYVSENNKMVYKDFDIPVCCTCKINP